MPQNDFDNVRYGKLAMQEQIALCMFRNAPSIPINIE
jgi:hypothetical protein